jgi:hypothetical protein
MNVNDATVGVAVPEGDGRAPRSVTARRRRQEQR